MRNGTAMCLRCSRNCSLEECILLCGIKHKFEYFQFNGEPWPSNEKPFTPYQDVPIEVRIQRLRELTGSKPASDEAAPDEAAFEINDNLIDAPEGAKE
jgi:hypothetical protein